MDNLALASAARASLAAKDSNPSTQSIGLRPSALYVRRSLTGHFGKLYDFSWASDSQMMLSAAQDGKVILWNAFRKLKRRVFNLDSKWTLCCDLSPSSALAAAGGLDNTISVFQTNLNSTSGDMMASNPNVSVSANNDNRPILLREHEGYLSSMTFVTDNKLISSSGDATVCVWDVARSTAIIKLREHESDVMNAQPCPTSPEGCIIASASCDSTVRLWDTRVSSDKSCIRLNRHESDVNKLRWLPDSSYVLASGSDDFTCKLHDIRSSKCELAVYCDERIISSVTALDFSKSGKLLFIGHDDGNIRTWDTLTSAMHLEFLAAEKRVTALEVSPDGQAVCSADWEGILNIWA